MSVIIGIMNIFITLYEISVVLFTDYVINRRIQYDLQEYTRSNHVAFLQPELLEIV